MAKEIYLCWVEDKSEFVDSLSGSMELMETDHDIKFDIDRHQDTRNLDVMARNINDDIIFLVDYNLKSSDGEGVDGDEVIRIIRTHNTNCDVIFYSSNATQKELRALAGDQPNVVCVIREDLIYKLREVVSKEKSTNA